MSHCSAHDDQHWRLSAPGYHATHGQNIGGTRGLWRLWRLWVRCTWCRHCRDLTLLVLVLVLLLVREGTRHVILRVRLRDRAQLGKFPAVHFKLEEEDKFDCLRELAEE